MYAIQSIIVFNPFVTFTYSEETRYIYNKYPVCKIYILHIEYNVLKY